MTSLNQNQYQKTKFKRNNIILIGIVAFLIITLISRLFFLQIIQHPLYKTKSEHNFLNTTPLTAKRGEIFDRNGDAIATNTAAYHLELIPKKIQNLDKTIEQLQTILPVTQDDIAQFKKDLSKSNGFSEIPLKMNLSEKEQAKFYVNSYRFPGVNIVQQLQRYYPLKAIDANITGYVGRINSTELNNIDSFNYNASDYIGKTGIEQTFEKELHGVVGAEQSEIDARGHLVASLEEQPAHNGDNIYLTIDNRLQKAAYQALGENAGALVAMNPTNGEILAMISKPSFDPNLFINGISQKDYEKLSHATKHPLFNRPLQGLYSPGSTIKPFLAIEALDMEIIDTQYKIFDPGWFKLPNTKHIYKDWKADGHGWVNLHKAIIVSCDTFFYNLAVKMGIKNLDHALDLFGFGHNTGIDINGELSGNVPTPEWKKNHKGFPWYTGDTVITGIGQGAMLVTPVQLAASTSIIANRGQYTQPHTILHIDKEENNTINVYTPPVHQSTLKLSNPKNWETVINAMQGVITDPEGSAERFGRHPGFSVAAKTGTAQIYGHHRNEEYSYTNIAWKLRNNHLFITFAPVDNPELVLSVVVEHAGTADAIARKVYDAYFEIKQQDALAQKNTQPIYPSLAAQ